MYVFTLSLFILLSYISLVKKVSARDTYFLLGLCMVWLVIHDGLRWEIGTDWEAYYNTFNTLDDTRVEAGYMVLLSFFRSFTDSYTLYLLAQAAFQYSIFYYIIKKYSCNPLVSVCFLYFLSLPLLGMNRQWIGLCLCLFALPFVFKRKFIPFAIIVLLSSTMQVVCLLFFLVFFLPSIKVTKSRIVVLMLVATFIGASGFINKFSFLSLFFQTTFEKKFVEADFDALYSFSYIGALRKYVMVYLFYKTIPLNKVSVELGTFFKMYFVGALMFLTFSGSFLQILIGRGALFFSIAEIFLAPYLIMHFNPPKYRRVLWLSIMVVYTFLLFRDLDGYIMIAGEDIFHPYKCVLFQ